ncbi:MAG: prepilin-type N-terminal cleavage/methylation domain-containing protein [Proteobacteria bacterium]|nr:prepilin-type N-terminal cleavage/methylation domain-containing protein [Pseudomonadota bacterium]
MKHSFAHARSKARKAPRTAGFTLIELMVALVLGLLVMLAVTGLFLSGQQSFRTNNALAEVQGSSRIAFELMARDIRESGLTGCNSANNRISNVLNNAPGGASTPAWWADWNNVVHGYVDATADPALAGFGAVGAPVAGANSIQLINAGFDPGATSAAYNDTAAQFTLRVPAPSLAAGDPVMVCTPSHAAILQINGFSAASGVATFAAAGGNPGNSSVRLGYPKGSLCTNNGAPEVFCFPGNSMVAKLAAVDWYIGNNAVGGTSLFRVSLQNTGGVPTPVTQEMVRNVSALTITYLNPSISAIATQFQPANVITTNNGWGGVTAVNVQLTASSTFQRASAQGNAPIARTYAFTTTLRNRVN